MLEVNTKSPARVIPKPDINRGVRFKNQGFSPKKRTSHFLPLTLRTAFAGNQPGRGTHRFSG